MSFFQPAVKAQVKARVAVDGPTGSGKTWTSLKWAKVLAGDQYERSTEEFLPDGTGRAGIALLDTERRSARKYANHFTFDVMEFGKPYQVPKLIEVLHAAESMGYPVVVIDSWSHFWEGEGGVLDVVDNAAQRNRGDKFTSGWSVGTPMQRNMVDEILDLDCHVIVTMRSKMQYALVEYTAKDGTTRTRPERIGLAPVQRNGVEYEFDVVMDMDLEHRGVISKSRCDVLADAVIQPHRETEAAITFHGWLNDGEATVTAADVSALHQLFDSIDDQETRILIKREFLDQYGRPEHLLAAQFHPALAWARERIALVNLAPPEDDAGALEESEGGEPAPPAGETDDEPAGDPASDGPSASPSDENDDGEDGGTLLPNDPAPAPAAPSTAKARAAQKRAAEKEAEAAADAA